MILEVGIDDVVYENAKELLGGEDAIKTYFSQLLAFLVGLFATHDDGTLDEMLQKMSEAAPPEMRIWLDEVKNRGRESR